MMNSIIRKTIRASFHLCRPFRRSPFSTAPSLADIPNEEEIDKLYKTIEIEMRANEHSVMTSYSHFARMAADNLGITVGKCHIAKTDYARDNLCLLRSGFANKNSRIQYEVRTYYRYMNFHNMTGSTADTFLEYIERNLPEGVALKITKVELRKLPEEISQPQKAAEEIDSKAEATSESQLSSQKSAEEVDSKEETTLESQPSSQKADEEIDSKAETTSRSQPS